MWHYVHLDVQVLPATFVVAVATLVVIAGIVVAAALVAGVVVVVGVATPFAVAEVGAALVVVVVFGALFPAKGHWPVLDLLHFLLRLFCKLLVLQKQYPTHERSNFSLLYPYFPAAAR